MGISVFILLLLPMVFAVSAVIATVILRASIALFNRIGGVSHQDPKDFIAQSQPAKLENVPGVSDPTNPYAAPSEYVPRADSAGFARGVPTAGFGKAFGIASLFMLVATVTNLMIGFALSQILASVDQIGFARGAAGLLGMVVQFVVFVALLKVMLPTTIGKACLVSLIFHAIAFVTATALGFIAGFLMMVVG